MFERWKMIKSDLQKYAAVKRNLVKLKGADSISSGAGNTISYVTVGIIGLFTLMFFSITLALGIGWALDNYFWGFLAVTVAYIIAGVVIWMNRESMFQLPILNGLIDKFFNK